MCRKMSDFRVLVSFILVLLYPMSVGAQEIVSVTRLVDGAIIAPDLDASLGANIQGPSMIRVPDWIEAPLGRYYLYFADHKGRYIRLAYADSLTGPWKIHVPGSVQIEESNFLATAPRLSPAQWAAIRVDVGVNDDSLIEAAAIEATQPHIASPDVHVDFARQRIRMYFHGLDDVATQVTRVAESVDGIHFVVRPEILGNTYMRTFDWEGYTYALAMPGQFYRSVDGLSNFAKGPSLFGPNMRHAALLLRGDTLFVFWTQVGDTPERILLSTIDLTRDWQDWRESPAVDVLQPGRVWEGSNAPLEPSIRGTAFGHVNQLRDPAIYEEDGRVFLIYAVAGESGLGISEISFEE